MIKVPPKKYIVWLDYGCEGWKPNYFDTLEDCINCENYGQGMMITKNVNLLFSEKQQEA
jgi:hypothetical protein